MTAKKPPKLPAPKRSKERAISADEENLWAEVTASVRPTKGKPRARIEARRGPADADPRPSAPAAPHGHPAAEPAAFHAPRPAGAARRAPAPSLAEFARRDVRHIAKGKVEIDARLDLHGLRQDEARHRLTGFIHACHAQGLRTVLVITGKGSSAPVDPLGRALGEPQRGVLRRLVPEWLDGAGLRAMVISFTAAGTRHGGDGALYVRLRRADRG